MSVPERKDILELGITSPILHNVLMYWQQGALTWEQTMMLAVLELDIQCNALQEELRRKHENRPHEG